MWSFTSVRCWNTRWTADYLQRLVARLGLDAPALGRSSGDVGKDMMLADPSVRTVLLAGYRNVDLRITERANPVCSTAAGAGAAILRAGPETKCWKHIITDGPSEDVVIRRGNQEAADSRGSPGDH